MSKIQVKGTEITILRKDNIDYISLTDMMKAKDGEFFISDWLRNRNTVEFIGVWEQLNNPNFNCGEFAIIKSQVGLNSYKLSVKEWVEKTNAIGLKATAGRYGGTYAHKDIAFEFGMWISAEFKLLLITEFQRLKDNETKYINSNWDIKRFLSKANYIIQTDAVKDVLIPFKNLPKDKEGLVYAQEADLLYQAMYGYTAKQWKENNPDLALKGHNIRDYATVHQLIVLNNLEIVNAELIRAGISIEDRLQALRRSSINQLKSILSSKKIDDKDAESPHKLISIEKGIDENVQKELNKEKFKP